VVEMIMTRRCVSEELPTQNERGGSL